MTTKRIPYETVKQVVESKGFILLSTTYKNSLQKLDVVCEKHGLQQITFKLFKNGSGCYDCGEELRMGHRRHSIDVVRADVEKAGYRLLAEKYKSVSIPLLMECPKHGQFETSYCTIQRGRGCRGCGYERVGDKKRTPFADIIKIVEKTPYILISSGRKSHKEKIELECKIHGYFRLSLDRLRSGQGCRKCGNIRTGLEARKTHEQFLTEVSHLGYEFLTPYEGAHTPMLIKCPKHGEFKMMPNTLLFGHGCAKCSNIESKAEKELFSIIKAVYPNTKKLRSKFSIDLKPFIKRFEIDIFVPELKRGIEYDGRYHHSFKKMRADRSKKLWTDEDILDYHGIKDRAFLSIGIQILHIKEEEWKLDKENCIKRCFDFLSNQS